MKDEKKPPQGAGVVQGGMDSLDYIEAQAGKNAAFRLETMELLNKRGHAMLALLLGGAGAAGAYALGRLGQPDALWSFSALVPVALWWFGLAAWVAVKICRTQELYPPTNEPQKLLEYMEGPLEVYRAELTAEGRQPESALVMLRRSELLSRQSRIDGYVKNNMTVAARLDRAYLCAAATPVWALVGILVVVVVKRCA
ncbi:hypothetical protein [Polaromonas sp. OV174]|uniref:hypothetical protein n=1 Tax=Polaromonas sp. OV174 TaxID=1855300 RepID=UPI000B84553D|nr:hypothetical protein [Polaromonas sp. OV174]